MSEQVPYQKCQGRKVKGDNRSHLEETCLCPASCLVLHPGMT